MGLKTRRDYTSEGMAPPNNIVSGGAIESVIVEPSSVGCRLWVEISCHI